VIRVFFVKTAAVSAYRLSILSLKALKRWNLRRKIFTVTGTIKQNYTVVKKKNTTHGIAAL